MHVYKGMKDVRRERERDGEGQRDVQNVQTDIHADKHAHTHI